MTSFRWQWRNLKRLKRLWFPEASKAELIRIVGPTWLWLHGAKTEHRVRYNGGWWAIDLSIPGRRRGVEADGGPHFTDAGKRRDILRDQALAERGWAILHITTQEMRYSPQQVRQRVRSWLMR